ncbi:MAG: Trm112 family protein [Candidatus Omnitrophica bacterium]|nr:Trm112 family protein [Candidatus Omnitrophota bacterium]
MVDPQLLEILACPACGGDVELRDNRVVCVKCFCKYPIKNGIPVLLADQAEL